MERHQQIAVGIFLTVAGYALWRDGQEVGFAKALVMLVFLMPIIFYRVVAWLSSFGFPEYFARDFGGRNHPGPYAFFFWLLFLIAAGVIVFDGSLY